MSPPRKKRHRALRDDERRLWDKVCASVTPLAGKNLSAPIDTTAPVGSDNNYDLALITPKLPRETPSTKQIWPEPAPDVKALAKSTQRAVSRGQVVPDARIDLHGDRYETAHKRLKNFIVNASMNGQRVVLVITGKGGTPIMRDDDIEYSGVIRRALPTWLGDPLLAKYVSSYTPAHPRHGGAGAWYVFVRPKARLLRQKR